MTLCCCLIIIENGVSNDIISETFCSRGCISVHTHTHTLTFYTYSACVLVCGLILTHFAQKFFYLFIFLKSVLFINISVSSYLIFTLQSCIMDHFRTDASLPPLDQWKREELLAGLCIASLACLCAHVLMRLHKSDQDSGPLIMTYSIHSANSG